MTHPYIFKRCTNYMLLSVVNVDCSHLLMLYYCITSMKNIYIWIYLFVTLRPFKKDCIFFVFFDGGPGLFLAAIYASTERFSLVWRCFCSSVSLVQLLNVIQLFMYVFVF